MELVYLHLLFNITMNLLLASCYTCMEVTVPQTMTGVIVFS